MERFSIYYDNYCVAIYKRDDKEKEYSYYEGMRILKIRYNAIKRSWICQWKITSQIKENISYLVG